MGLPTRWSDRENVAWKTRLRGLGSSTPIVWGDRVIVTSQIGGGVVRRDAPPLVQPGVNAAVERPLGGEAAPAVDTDRVTFLVTAFDHSTGRRLWEFELPSEGNLPSVHELHNLASSSPVTDGERIYAWFGTGQIVALDMNGKLVWKRHLGAEYSPFDILWGHASSPIVYQDTVILLCYHNPASYLLAVDRRTGETRWKVARGRRDLACRRQSLHRRHAQPSNPDGQFQRHHQLLLRATERRARAEMADRPPPLSSTSRRM